MITTVLAFLVTLAVLIVVHEYGHYRTAVACGVKVLRFSIGFGRVLWRRVGRDGTEFTLSALPLGGYVRMLDERDGMVAPHERSQAFNQRPLRQRAAIVGVSGASLTAAEAATGSRDSVWGQGLVERVTLVKAARQRAADRPTSQTGR